MAGVGGAQEPPFGFRSLAISPEDPNLIVAGIELGGVVRSTDGGESWQDQRPGAYADCHALATHVSAPATLYEAAGGGFAESKDFGESWTATDAGIAHRYVWGLAVDRDDPALLYVSAAEGPGRAHSSGFSDALYAGFGDGSILHSPNAGSSWDEVAQAPGLDALAAVAV